MKNYSALASVVLLSSIFFPIYSAPVSSKIKSSKVELCKFGHCLVYLGSRRSIPPNNNFIIT